MDRKGEANAWVEGHIHFYMDVDPVPNTPAEPAAPTDANATWADLSVTSHTFYHVPCGMHTFAIQLLNNDQTSVVQAISDSVTVIVAP